MIWTIGKKIKTSNANATQRSAIEAILKLFKEDITPIDESGKTIPELIGYKTDRLQFIYY